MKLPRRIFLRLAAGTAVLPSVSRIARAQAYPSRPVRIIVAGPVDGGSTRVARLIGQTLSERLGQPFVVENQPGAGNNIGTEAVVRAPADGYTLLLATTGNAINATLYEKLSFNFIRDISPVVGIARIPFVMQVNPSFPAKMVPEFIAYAKANPGKINCARVGNGTTSHLASELFKMLTGIEMVHVPYTSVVTALNDLISGQLQVMFASAPTSIEFVKAGKLRPLAVTTATRSEALPDIPTVGQSVPGYDASDWYGVGVPRNTPAEIIEKLNREFNAVLAEPNIKAQLASLGLVLHGGSPADFGKLIADETDKWSKVVKFSGAKPD
jgi:tripartite-type tricarboxylate transporter receptor subunit TctC